MKKFLTAGLTACILLTACQKSDDETKKQLAALQEQLAQQQKLTAEKEAEEKRAADEQRQLERENAIREEAYYAAQEDLKYQAELAKQEEERKAAEKKETERKAAEKKAAERKSKEQQATKETANTGKATEKLARYPAFVITESGSGTLNLRGAPSSSAVVVTQLSDGASVQVVATTNQCTAQGCWVKVNYNGMTGYVSDAYLQRGNPSPTDESDWH